MMRSIRVVAACWLVAWVSAATGGEAEGTLEWTQRVELGMPVSGVVAEVHVAPGQTVAAGDALVSLDRRDFVDRRDRPRAEHRHAEVLLDEARREDERAAEMYDRTVLSDYERNQARIALAAAEAQLARAADELTRATLALERSRIRAPFDARVLWVDAAPGQAVVSELASRPLVVVAEASRVRVRFAVSVEDTTTLQPGASVVVRRGDRQLQARIDFVGHEPVDGTGAGVRYPATATLDNPSDRPLRVGEPLTVLWE
jgi:multidrug efflux system membrane fusion protein